MTMTCPKCGHQRSSTDDPAIPDGQCPACGIYYFKYLNQKNIEPRTTSQRKISIARKPFKLQLNWLTPIITKLKSMVVLLWKFICSKMTLGRLFWLIILSFFVWQYQNTQTKINDPEFIKSYQQRQAIEKANCKKELKCWAAKYEGELIGPCKRLIEKHAKYNAQWSDDWSPIFSRYRWHGTDNTSITYIGDKVKFQNGFGAWQNMIYECDLNPETNKLFGVRVNPGKL